MPNGRTHAAATVITASAAAFVDPYIAAGCLAGVFIHPDLDQAETRKGIWYGYWKLYGRLFPHRGISHWPMIGTMTRILYLAVPIFIFSWVTGYTFDLPAFKVIFGLMVADAVHAGMDIFVSILKRIL